MRTCEEFIMAVSHGLYSVFYVLGKPFQIVSYVTHWGKDGEAWGDMANWEVDPVQKMMYTPFTGWNPQGDDEVTQPNRKAEDETRCPFCSTKLVTPDTGLRVNIRPYCPNCGKDKDNG